MLGCIDLHKVFFASLTNYENNFANHCSYGFGLFDFDPFASKQLKVIYLIFFPVVPSVSVSVRTSQGVQYPIQANNRNWNSFFFAADRADSRTFCARV